MVDGKFVRVAVDIIVHFIDWIAEVARNAYGNCLLMELINQVCGQANSGPAGVIKLEVIHVVRWTKWLLLRRHTKIDGVLGNDSLRPELVAYLNRSCNAGFGREKTIHFQMRIRVGNRCYNVVDRLLNWIGEAGRCTDLLSNKVSVPLIFQKDLIKAIGGRWGRTSADISRKVVEYRWRCRSIPRGAVW